jgi:hypothetical protein
MKLSLIKPISKDTSFKVSHINEFCGIIKDRDNMKDYREILAKQLEEIFKKQEEITINDNLARICRELDGFTEKIKDCLEKNQDLQESDKKRIQELNDEYNSNIDRYKKLKGY